MDAPSVAFPPDGHAPDEPVNNGLRVRSKRRHTLPDANWIRREILISDVARTLGLKGDGKVFDCFRDHPSGKRRRSLSVDGTRNMMRCFTCDKHSLSNIDLVMQFQGCDVSSAIRWIAGKFPDTPTAEIRVSRNQRSYRANRTKPFTLQNLITSPGWAALSPSAGKVLTAIFARASAAGSEQGCLRCTYKELMRWTGIGSRITISSALKELRKGAITTCNVPTNYRTRRGFWLTEMFVRVSPRAMHRPASRGSDSRPRATSNSVQEMNSQYAVQNLDSGLTGGPE